VNRKEAGKTSETTWTQRITVEDQEEQSISETITRTPLPANDGFREGFCPHVKHHRVTKNDRRIFRFQSPFRRFCSWRKRHSVQNNNEEENRRRRHKKKTNRRKQERQVVQEVTFLVH
jgi:hypothetical protein